ncbi:MAG: single-stranded-DNA-specific exonuclease [Pseudohongiellaceae bacterium]|jgi:single-stranded-DNA-specific exonuclease
MVVNVQRRIAPPLTSLPESVPLLLRKIYEARGIQTLAELELSLANLLPPGLLKGIDAATQLLLDGLKKQQRFLIVSDFDADGATSCVLAMKALRSFGAIHVDYIVPNRFEYGYGLTPEIVELAKTRKPDLIITVDNGISSIEGVAAAQAAGIKVLVTDHHLPGRQAPAAEAIVNPNQVGCEFPSKCIAGVGVIFYTMLALRARLRDESWFAEKGLAEPNMADLLDLVALGTVADVVPLDRNNRILVSEGLKRIRVGQCRQGITAILKIANRQAIGLKASDLGFSIGPRLNAAGRLDDMATGIECLLAESEGEAHQLALLLDSMNQDRKQIESDMRDQAFAYLDELDFAEDDLPAALTLFDERWHQGVVGILASRVKEKYHRPVIAFADVSGGDKDGELKGSARSIAGFHIRDALDAVATQNPGLVTKFGGHAMAAGLSLVKSRLGEFSEAFAAQAKQQLKPEQLQAILLSDGELAAAELNLRTATELGAAGPWGQEFPEPIFDGRFSIVQQRRVGTNHLKLVLAMLTDPQHTIDAIAFNVDKDNFPGANHTEIEVAYRLDINEFRGVTSAQLMVEHIIAYY